MGFEFGLTNTTVKAKNRNAIVDDICLYSRNNGKKNHILFLLEYPLEGIDIKTALSVWTTKNFPGYDIDIVSASVIKATDDQIKKHGIYRFYLENRSDFNKYIREGTIVIPFGYVLSAVTLSNDLSTECFHDIVFNKTFFFCQQTNTYVFPIDSIHDLFKRGDYSYTTKDSSRLYFALYQFRYIKDHIEELQNPLVPDRLYIEKLKTKADWKAFFEEHRRNTKENKVAWDLETTGLDYFTDRVLCITMSFDGKKGYYIPWNIVNLEELDILLSLKYQIGQNLKFDVKFLKHLGMKCPYINSDTLQLGQLMNEMRFNGLKSLAYHYTLYGGYDEELDRFKDKYHPKDYSQIPVPLMSTYAAMDAIVTFLVHEKLQEQLTWIDNTYPPIHEGGWTVRQLYEKVKIPSCNSFTGIEMGGLYVDEEKWDTNAAIVESKIRDIKEKLREALQMGTNESLALSFSDDNGDEGKDALQSGMKLGAILKARGWENLGITKQGWYKTGDEQLERWKQLGHTEAELLQNLHAYLTMQKTFLGKPHDYSMGWRRYVRHHSDGTARIHPSYKSMMMATLRNGCGDPNYQQGPAHAKEWAGKEQIDIAKIFKQIYSVPDKNKYFLVTLDYSGFQMRLAAIDSKDPELFNGFKNNPKLDVHSKTGYNVFCKEAEFDIEEIVVDGKVFFPHEEVRIIRNGKTIKVKASQLKQEDKLK